ncbi:phosphatase [Treponema sp.]
MSARGLSALYTTLVNMDDGYTHMRIRIDTHTHSVASGHAYSTIDDLARGAKRRRLSGFVLTDHGPLMPGATHPYHFGNLRVIPEHIQGVRFYRGVEANIMDMQGTIDMGLHLLVRLDFVMAGFHEICFEPRSREENTRALIATLENPYVDAISHPGNPAFPIDAEAVVRSAAINGKALEINNSSFKIRRGSAENCKIIAELCLEHGTRIVCSSDAHYWEDVGNFKTALQLIHSVKIPESMVINASVARFEEFCAERKLVRERALEVGI